MSSTSAIPVPGLLTSLRLHWPEYLIEAVGLGTFMISALGFTVLLEHPASPVRGGLAGALERRMLIGLAMGATAIALVYSPWGKQSGAHFNPAFTFTFWRLGRIGSADAALYCAAQFVGALIGVGAIGLVMGRFLADIKFAVTVPGPAGIAAAFAGELVISFGLMATALIMTNRRGANRFTGLVIGGLIALYITVEAPLSGMSMNPARTFGSAVAARSYPALWLYFIAPLAGMLLAAELYVRSRGPRGVRCAKLHHDNDRRCIFRCRWENSN